MLTVSLSIKGGGVTLSVILKKKTSDVTTAFIIWTGNFPNWKLAEGWRRCLTYQRQTDALVMLHMKKRADAATLQAPIPAAMTLRGVREDSTC